MGLIYGLIFLLIISLLTIALFIYSIKKKLIIGKIISVLLIVGIASCFLTNNIDEWTISNKEVITDLHHIDINLSDKFKITNNEVTGMPERNQVTEIIISEKDKLKIIEDIQKSSNFKDFKSRKEYLADTSLSLFNKEGQIINYYYENSFHREKYSRIDNYPTQISLTINTQNNKVHYLRLED